MGNLVRRKALAEEFLCPAKILHTIFRRAHALERSHNGSVVHGCHIEHTPPLRQSSASDFVGASQGVFTTHRAILLKSSGIRSLQFVTLVVLNILIHSRTPSRKYRATNTRASSVALACRARIFSAALWGG